MAGCIHFAKGGGTGCILKRGAQLQAASGGALNKKLVW